MRITAIEAVTERSRAKGVAEHCKKCKHSYDDVDEGWNCRRFDATIVLSSGSTLMWPGQACDRAYANDCRGEWFEKSPFALIKGRPFYAQVICALLTAVAFSTFLVWWKVA